MNIFLIIPAYNAEKKLVSVIERIPHDFWKITTGVIIINDGSKDRTSEKINEIAARWGEKIFIIDKKENDGYARAQKDGFSKALELGADACILLHSDGQYAPELLPLLFEPLLKEEADMVQGSRMMSKQDAIRGGMPTYKFLANIFLSTLENYVYGLDFAEYHSGYMLYSRRALEIIPFRKLSDTFHFDGEMLLVGAKKGLRIKEIPIPTRYADEKSHVKPVRYGFQVMGIMIKYLRGGYNF